MLFLIHHHNSKTLHLFLDGPENIRFSSSKSGVAVGKNEKVTITCTGNANPAPTFTIYRNQTILLNDSASGSYTINSFDSKDAGNYSCLVKNDVSSKLIGGVMFIYNESKVICKSNIFDVIFSCCKIL